MARQSLKRVLTKFALTEIGWIVFAFIFVFVIVFQLMINMKVIYPANHVTEQVEKIATDWENSDGQLKKIPRNIEYALLSKKGKILDSTVKETKDIPLSELIEKPTHHTMESGILYQAQYRYFSGKEKDLVLRYKLACVFRNPTLAQLFPNAEIIINIFLIIFLVSGFILIILRFSWALQRELQKIALESKSAERLGEGRWKNSSKIKEIDEILRMLEEMDQELKKSLQVQWKQKAELEEAVQAITHDFQTPVTLIQGNLKLLMEMNLDAEQKECVVDARKGVW